MTDTTETARALLYRHGLPEDVIDGALCLHAQELAGKIRAHRDSTRGAVQATKVMDFAADLISPENWARAEPAAAAGSVPAADRAALAEDLRYALTHREPGHDHEQPGVWDGSGMQCGHCARLAVARGNLAAYDAGPDAVLPAPADRAAEVANLRAMYDAVSKREHELIEERDRLAADRAAVLRDFLWRLEQSAGDAAAEKFLDDNPELRRMADETPQPAEDPTPDQPVVRATRYLVACVPEHRDPGGYRGITVEYRGDDQWAILHYALCLGTDGRWARERQSSERDEEWLATHRFDLATARRLAEEQAKDLVRPAKDHRPAASAQPADETAERVVAYRSPGTRTLYCVTCARQETGWQPITGAEVRDDAVCDFCGGQCLGIASQTLGAVIARYDAEQPAKEA